MSFRLLLLRLLLGWLVVGSCSRPGMATALRPRTDTLFLQQSNDVHLSETYRYYTGPLASPARPSHADSLWQAGRFRLPPWRKPLSLGFCHERLWLRLVVVNTLPDRARFVWSLYNFTDSATLYCRREPGGQFERVAAASSWVPANGRVFPARALCLPFALAAGERAVLYLRAEHQSGSVYLPSDVTTTEDFLAWEATYPFEWYWVWLLGFYLSSALFNLVLFAFLRDRIHIWYVLYVSCTTIFLLMEDGLDALLLPHAPYQLLWTVGQTNFMLLAAACGVRIMQLFVRLTDSQARLHRVGNGLIGSALLFVVVYTLVFGWAVREKGIWLTELTVVRELLLILLFGYSWVVLIASLLRRRQRKLAFYYTPTYLLFFGGCTLFMLNRAGLTNFNLVRPNALAWALLLELLVLSVLLTGRFRYTLRQIARLRIRQLNQRNALGARLIAAQEEERTQLAQELHDALGPNLTALHLAWQGPAMQQALAYSPEAAAAGRHTAQLLRQLRDEVRTFSHALLPLEPDQKSLSESLQGLGALINASGHPVVVHTYCDASVDALAAPVQLAAYRIAAELLNNALRHAQASEVLVQLLLHPGALEIMVEDNGQGFTPNPKNAGIGLKGVQARTDYLRGTMHIDSSSHGTSVVVRLPYS